MAQFDVSAEGQMVQLIEGLNLVEDYRRIAFKDASNNWAYVKKV